MDVVVFDDEIVVFVVIFVVMVFENVEVLLFCVIIWG